MHRFFVKPNQVQDLDKKIDILGDDVKHISKVLRLKEGQEIEICDGEGMEYLVIIDQIHKDKITTSIQDTYTSKREPKIEIILYQGIPKSTKMDFVIQKCTELGIHTIVPIETKRTVVKIENAKAEKKKIDRWQRIAYEAAKQSKRGKVPTITPIKTLEEVWEEASSNDLNIVAYENETSRAFKYVLENQKGPLKKIGILVGPEGGLELWEVGKARENRFYSVSLGPRILRTETAGFAMLAIIMYVIEDF